MTQRLSHISAKICDSVAQPVSFGADSCPASRDLPSACSLDTGLIMTVYLYDPLVADATNITAGYTVFQYYNNVGTQDIFDSFQLVPFTLIIDTYDSATAIAKGRFYGYVDTDRHGAAQIRDGKYAIHFDN